MGREKAGREREGLPGTTTGPAQTWGRFSRYSSALLLFFTFCAVAVVGLFVIRDLRRADKDQQNMYRGSVLSLHRIADLEYQTQETRRSTLYALSTADSNLHVKYADQSREADHLVSEGITAYLENAGTQDERDIGKRLDELIVRNVPNVRKAVKWNSPFYGIEAQGWFLAFHVFTHYVKVSFFKGTSLRPVPPGGTGKDARWIDIHEDDFDEAQIATWVKKAAALPGWDPGQPS